MPRSTDPRKIVGNIVEAKALHVTSLAECTRRYGANKASKMLKGVVVDTTTTTSSKTNRTSTTVTADYNLGGGVIKRATINVRSLKGITTPTASEGLSQTTTTSESRVEGLNDNNNSNTIIERFLDELEVELAPFSPNRPPLRRRETILEEERALEPNNLLFENEIENNPTIATATEEPEEPGLVDTVNDTKWFENHNLQRTDLNGPHNIREWGVRSQMGDIYRSGCNNNNQISRLDVFF